MKILNRFLILVMVTVVLSLTVTVASAQQPVTINVWTYSDMDAIMPAAIDAFQAKYPYITVQVTDIPEDDFVTKLDTAFLANQPPDVAPIYDRKWIAADDFMAIDDAAAAQGINLDDLNKSALEAGNCYVDEHLYCLGSYTGAVLMFYNKDLLDKAGIAYPSATEPMTVDQYAEMARALTVHADNIQDRVWGSDAKGYWFLDFRNYFSPDIHTTEGYVNDAANVHALQVMADLVADDSIISDADAGQFATDALLTSGQLATTITDNAYAIPLLETANVRWGASVPPVAQAGDAPHSDQWTDGLGVPKNSANPDAAALFVAFWGSEGSQLRMQVTGDLPLNLKLAADMNWAGDSEGRQNVLDAVKVSTPRVFIPLMEDVFPPLDEAFYTNMLEDGMSAQDALDQAAPLMQQNLDQAWNTWNSYQSN